MTTYTLMNGTGQVGGQVAPVSVPGLPTKAAYTLALTGPASNFAAVTLLGSTDRINYDAIGVIQVDPQGPNTVPLDLRSPGSYVSYAALLNYITPGGYSASVSMTV
jgi:hypothetical protein